MVAPSVRVTSSEGLEFIRQLTLLERTLSKRLSEVLEAHGTTIEQWRVLSLLAADNAGRPMNTIADYIMAPAPTLTKVVDRMVSAGLVFRRPDDVDRRRVLVYASKRGLAVLSEWDAAATRETDDFAAAAGIGEIARLRETLTLMTERLGLHAADDA